MIQYTIQRIVNQAARDKVMQVKSKQNKNKNIGVNIWHHKLWKITLFQQIQSFKFNNNRQQQLAPACVDVMLVVSLE